MDVVRKRKHQPIENTVNMQLNCLIGVVSPCSGGYHDECQRRRRMNAPLHAKCSLRGGMVGIFGVKLKIEKLGHGSNFDNNCACCL